MSQNFLPQGGAKSDAVLPQAPPEQRDPQAVSREEAGRAADHILDRSGHGQVVVLSNGGVGLNPRGSVVKYDRLIVVQPPPPGQPGFDYKRELTRLLALGAIRPASMSEVTAADAAASRSFEGSRVIALPEAAGAAVVSQSALIAAETDASRLRQMLVQAGINPDTGESLTDAEKAAYASAAQNLGAPAGGTNALPDAK